MPILPLGACSVHRCPGRATHKGKCEAHFKQWQEQYERSRPSPRQRGYGPYWTKRRAEFLSRNPVCCVEGCGAAATVPDHFPVSVAEGKRRGWSDQQIHADSNLRPMCKTANANGSVQNAMASESAHDPASAFEFSRADTRSANSRTSRSRCLPTPTSRITLRRTSGRRARPLRAEGAESIVWVVNPR